MTTQQHPGYYLEDGNIIFLVDSHLYRVHRYFFLQSPVFKDMISLPVPSGEVAEGTTDEHPIVLAHVDRTEFDCLLWFFYHSQYNDYTLPFTASLSITKVWTSILHLAQMWDFQPIRDIALLHLKDMDLDPIDKIAICEQYSLGIDWAFQSYVSLCTRSAPLAIAEATKIPVETVVRIAAIRESFRGPPRGFSNVTGSIGLQGAIRDLLDGEKGEALLGI